MMGSIWSSMRRASSRMAAAGLKNHDDPRSKTARKCAGREQIFSPRIGRNPRADGARSRSGGGGIPGADGAVGFREIDAAESDWRSGPGRERDGGDRERPDRPAIGPGAGGLARAARG